MNAERALHQSPRAPQSEVELCDLPFELLLRIVRMLIFCDGVRNQGHLRDAWNVAHTCPELYKCVKRLNHTLQVTELHMQMRFPYDIVESITLPADVMKGTFMALLGSTDFLRVVEFGAMPRRDLQRALRCLRFSQQLEELRFVDVGRGVCVPTEVAVRLETLCIVSPRAYTLHVLCDMLCAPTQLELLNVDFQKCSMQVFDRVWRQLTHRCISVDVTHASTKRDLSLALNWDSHGWRPPLTHVQRQSMHVRQRFSSLTYGIKESFCMRAEGAEAGRFDDGETSVSDWIGTYIITRLRGRDMPIAEGLNRGDRSAFVELNSECADDKGPSIEQMDEDVDVSSLGSSDLERERWSCGSWHETSSAHDIYQRKNGMLGREFVQDVVGVNGIGALLVTSEPLSSCSAASAWIGALAAKQMAMEAGKVRVLAVSAPVFCIFRDVLLPEGVESVGILDAFATEELVKAIPATLKALARLKTVRSVWIDKLDLLHHGSCDVQMLRRALRACRHAEAAGLCVVGLRGRVEHWLMERTG
eukprot:TRINITY_DN195_c0_g3_i1.p1 TRINITY_DN195_c0_g3~~TRINITY_DN195_c0_g3_i1.p1  ORF type:complete len:531 (-),score=67.66 TRINITY_DN195_c0_g3_i1:703-2295(-)